MTDQQNTPPEVDLLPCPFCAGEAELADVDAAYYVMCSVDGCWANSCVSLWRDRSEAIATWNTRPVERTARPDDASERLAPCADLLTMSPAQFLVLDRMADDLGYPFCDIAADCGLSVGEVRAIIRQFHSLGMTGYGPLYSEDDHRVVGKGYWLSGYGAALQLQMRHWMPLPPPPGSEIADAALNPQTASDDAAGERAAVVSFLRKLSRAKRDRAVAGEREAVVSLLRKLSRAKRDRASEEKGLVVTQSPFLAMSSAYAYAAYAIERGEHRAALAQGEATHDA